MFNTPASLFAIVRYLTVDDDRRNCGVILPQRIGAAGYC
jgi:hypothetical protein